MSRRKDKSEKERESERESERRVKASISYACCVCSSRKSDLVDARSDLNIRLEKGCNLHSD